MFVAKDFARRRFVAQICENSGRGELTSEYSNSVNLVRVRLRVRVHPSPLRGLTPLRGLIFG